MPQAIIYNEDKDFFTIEVRYDGSDDELKKHEIDATLYSFSIAGYTKFLSEIANSFSTHGVEIYVSAHGAGSFKTIIKVSWNAFLGFSAITSVLGWFSITPQSIGEVFVLTQDKIIMLIDDCKGNTEAIVNKVLSQDTTSDDFKKFFVTLVKNNKLRKGLDDFTKPLLKTGYDEIHVSSDNETSFTIQKNQRESFEFIPPDVVIENQFSETVKILYLSPELTEWKFHGRKDFWAEVKDIDFLNKTKNKLFSELQGKYYKVSGTVRTTKKEGAQKGTTHWVINKVSDFQEAKPLF